MEFIFGLVGVIIGGGLVYFLFVNKLQRQLDSAERKLERANRAVEESESGRSQQTLQAQELQNERQKTQSLETSYQAQLRNLEQSYELQLQEVEKAQGNSADLVDSQDQIRQIKQSYQAQIQELQADRQQEKQAIEQAHQSQIRELQQAHQQELEEIQQRQVAPIQSFDTPPETQQAGGWGVPAAIAGVAGAATWAASSFLNREPEEAPIPEEPITESTVAEEDDWQVEESPFEVSENLSEENWVDQPIEEAVLSESELMGWKESEQPLIVEEPITEESAWQTTESLFEVPEDLEEETPEPNLDENWSNETLEENLAAPDLSAWIEPEQPLVVEEPITEESAWQTTESLFEVPEDLEEETPELTLDENWSNETLEENLAAPDLSAWIEPEQSLVIEEPITEESAWQITESLFEVPEGLEEETIEITDSWDLGESFASLSEVELLSSENLQAQEIEGESSSSELDFLSMLQGEESLMYESEEFSSLMETAEPALPDFLGDGKLNDDLPFLDMFSADKESLADIPETLAGETNDPFINFFDSETEKSDLEFLEMLKTDENDLENRSGLYESDDLFGDLFSSEAPKLNDINDLFESTEPKNSKTDQDGLLELFGDDALPLDDWDLSDPDKSSLP